MDHSTARSPPGAAGDSETLSPHLSVDTEDDDIDYAPPTGEDEDEFFETEDADSEEDPETEREDQDATEDEEMEIELSLAGDESGNGEIIEDVRVRHSNGAPAAIRISPHQIVQLLGNVGFRRLLAAQDIVGRGPSEGDNEDDEAAVGANRRGGRRSRRQRASQIVYPPVPSPEGQKLMASGLFGRNESTQDFLRRRNKALARKLMARELDQDRSSASDHTSALAQDMIPSTQADTIIHYDRRCYSGQFSDDGNFFFSCSQDFIVRMYDTSNPYDWRHYKSVEYPFPQWTITDATLSPDNKYLAYTSIRSMVCLAPTDPSTDHEPYILEFANLAGRSARRAYGSNGFGIWSIRFSGDGKELVAGTGNDSVYVYDIEQNTSVLRIQGHQEDVNAVCFGDQSSPHILYSGSDDTLIKVWDRRSMRDNRAAGVFVGHTEGVTYVDSKGDGRYVLSNGKDQTMKLWDLRKMMSTEQAAKLNPRQYGTGFDYRFMSYSDAHYDPHPHDCSVVTYRGHRVLKTLIRCHFSPPDSTNSRYVYSGSEDGKVYVYNLDATIAGKIDVQATTRNTRPPGSGVASRYYLDEAETQTWKTCVRDASWHPNVPMLAATSWNGWGSLQGTCTIHSWQDGPADDESGIEMGRRVDAEMHERRDLYGDTSPVREANRSTLRSQRVRRAGNDDDEW